MGQIETALAKNAKSVEGTNNIPDSVPLNDYWCQLRINGKSASRGRSIIQDDRSQDAGYVVDENSGNEFNHCSI